MEPITSPEAAAVDVAPNAAASEAGSATAKTAVVGEGDGAMEANSVGTKNGPSSGADLASAKEPGTGKETNVVNSATETAKEPISQDTAKETTKQPETETTDKSKAQTAAEAPVAASSSTKDTSVLDESDGNLDKDSMMKMILSNDVSIWCQACNVFLEGPCRQHGATVPDPVALPRALATLPAGLVVEPVPGTKERGVFAKTEIPALSIYGPLCAPTVRKAVKSNFVFALAAPNGTLRPYVLESDDLCNWMKYVRLAGTAAQQNAMAYQQDEQIYFTALRNIEPGEEVRVWYSRPYGTVMGKPPLTPPAEKVTSGKKKKANAKAESATASTSNGVAEHADEEMPDVVETGKRKTRGRQRKSYTPVGRSSEPSRAKRGIEKVTAESPEPAEKAGDDLPPPLDLDTSSASDRSKRRKGRPRKYVAESGDGEKEKEPDASAYDFPAALDTDEPAAEPPKTRARGRLAAAAAAKLAKESPVPAVAVAAKRGRRGRKPPVGEVKIASSPKPRTKRGKYKTKAPAEGKEKKKRVRAPYISPTPPTLNSTTYRCPCPEEDCKLRFRTPELLNVHALKHGPINEPELVSKTCPGCQLALPTVEELIAHVDTRHSKQLGSRGVSEFQCQKCKIYFKSDENLQTHERIVHTVQKERTVECDTCHLKFLTVVSMQCHRKTHFERRYLSCPVCLATFQNGSALKEHSESHGINGVYACHLCEKSWTTFTRLRRHLRTIHSTARFECDKCDMVFNRKSRLDAHVVVHSDTMDHVCDICGRPFRRQDRLREHILAIHKVERIGGSVRKSAYQVKLGNVRKRARMTNYLDYDYKCEPCQVGFCRRGMLVKHMANLHPDQPLDSIPEVVAASEVTHTFVCQHCDKAFSSASQRKTHIKKKHAAEGAATAASKEAAGERAESSSNGGASNAASALADSPAAITPAPEPEATFKAPERVPCTLCTLTYLNAARLRSHQWAKHPELFPTT